MNDLQSLDRSFDRLSIKYDIEKIIKFQSIYRGYMLRAKQLPLIMYKIKKYLENYTINFSYQTLDGRINSFLDEEKIISLLNEKFDKKIIKPKLRMWYDFLALDYIYGWIPINIKTTTMKTNDNVGNLAMCVYAYTDVKLDINRFYDNKKMSDLLIEKLQNKKYNKIHKKDYYFIVLNKNKPSEIIVNSVNGLTYLTPNLNNLPFQVRWNKNKFFNYDIIQKKSNYL